eukprot:Nk52_evm24s2630 gene=Nk52_evmTU24s2630
MSRSSSSSSSTSSSKFFPSDFHWGTATAAYQVEGNHWIKYEKQQQQSNIPSNTGAGADFKRSDSAGSSGVESSVSVNHLHPRHSIKTHRKNTSSTSSTASRGSKSQGLYLEDYGRGLCIWDPHVHTPGKVFNNDTADVSCDHYHKFREDIKLLASLNITHYRMSISWSRVLPTGRRTRVGDGSFASAGSSHEKDCLVNDQGVEFYRAVLQTLREHKIEPVVTLYHWDLPLTLQEEYDGWVSREVVDDFADYCRFCFDTFGDLVRVWCTINEPWVTSYIGHELGVFPPCKRHSAYISAHYQLLAHAEACHVFRSEGFQEKVNGEIGLALNTDWAVPFDASKECDVLAAERSMLFNLGWFADPVFKGDYPFVMRQRVDDVKSEKEVARAEELYNLIGDGIESNVDENKLLALEEEYEKLTKSWRLPLFSRKEKEKLLNSSSYFGLNYYTSKAMEDMTYLEAEDGDNSDTGVPSADFTLKKKKRKSVQLASADGSQCIGSQGTGALINRNLSTGGTEGDGIVEAGGEEEAYRGFDGDKGVRVHAIPDTVQGQSFWLQSVPWGLRALLKWISNRYDPEYAVTGKGVLPIIITECGFSCKDEHLWPVPKVHVRQVDEMIACDEDGGTLKDGMDGKEERLGEFDIQRACTRRGSSSEYAEIMEINDIDRVNYMKEHLENARLSICEDGVALKGFYYWSFLDNFEWNEGYETRFGMCKVDFNHPERTRIVKRSGKEYSKLILKYSNRV